MIVRLVAMMIVAIATLGTVQSSLSSPQGTLTVTVLSCLDDLNNKPELSYLKMNDPTLGHALLDGPMGLARHVPNGGARLAPGVYRFKLTLAPGNYEIYLRSGKCFGGQVMAVVLSGRQRSTSIVAGDAWTMLFDHDHAGAAGTMAFRSARIELVNAEDPTNSRFVDVEDGAFYIDSLQRDRWILRVWTTCCEHADFPVDLSGVRPGDYAYMHLTAPDVISRLGYSGQMFSSPRFVAGGSSGVWYTNDGRNTVGIAQSNGAHREFNLPNGHSPDLIVSDGAGGSWFSENGGIVGHADEKGRITELPLTTQSREHPRVAQLLPQADGSLLVITSYPTAAFQVTLGAGAAEVEVPADIDLFQAGISVDGRSWFNVKDRMDVASFGGGKFTRLSVAPVQLAPEVTRVGEAFVSLKQKRGPSVLVGTFQQSAGNFPDGAEGAVNDGNGGVWIFNCFQNAVTHAGSGIRTKELHDIECPSGGIADGDGGVWFIADHASQIVHATREDDLTTYRVPIDAGTIGNLSLDAQGVLWFPERSANRMGFLAKGSVGEIGLGNPGATPGLSVIP